MASLIAGNPIASDLVANAATIANDTLYVRWTKAEWLGWLNAGQKAIVALAPEAGVKTNQPIVVPADTVRCSLPTSGVALVSVLCNAEGGAIRMVDREFLDSRYPSWRTSRTVPGGAISAYVYDPKTPTVFDIWPAQGSVTTVKADYVAVPDDVPSLDSSCNLGDRYAEPLINFMLFRAHAKDTQPDSAQKAQLYYTAFVNLVAGNSKVLMNSDPAKGASNVLLNPNVATHYGSAQGGN